MTEEIGILKDNKAWELVHLPNYKKTIKCKWSPSQKHLPNGNVHKFKARVVAKSYTHKVGIDHIKTFSLVVSF